MTHQIVKVDNYLFAIGDNYKHDVFPYLVIEKQTNGGYVVWQVDNLNDWDEKNQYQILAHLPLHNAPFLEGVPLLPPFEQEDDVENMGEDATNLRILKHKTPSQVARQYFDGYVEGYNKAREKFQFTEEDIRAAIAYGRCLEITKGFSDITISESTLDSYIQSLQQPKLPIGFECEMVSFDVDMGLGDKCIEDGKYPKTITNSEGRTEWVGKWVY